MLTYCILTVLQETMRTWAFGEVIQNDWKYFRKSSLNKAGYTATEVACGWAGAIFKATPSFGQEQ